MRMFTAGDAGTAIGRPRTFLNIVLDESSSMESSADETRRAYNDFIRQQQAASEEAKDEVFVTLTKFSNPRRVRTNYALVRLRLVPTLTKGDYKPDGDTALYDGIWCSISSMEQAVGEHARVLTLVITDGYENASQVVTDVETMRGIISSREERGNWTFIFLSAGSNPFGVAKDMGFRYGNVRSYSGAMGSSLVRATSALRDYRTGDRMQTDTFWAGEAPKHERPAWTQTGTDDVEDVV
jgi:hypothetical protein